MGNRPPEIQAQRERAWAERWGTARGDGHVCDAPGRCREEAPVHYLIQSLCQICLFPHHSDEDTENKQVTCKYRCNLLDIHWFYPFKTPRSFRQ